MEFITLVANKKLKTSYQGSKGSLGVGIKRSHIKYPFGYKTITEKDSQKSLRLAGLWVSDFFVSNINNTKFVGQNGSQGIKSQRNRHKTH